MAETDIPPRADRAVCLRHARPVGNGALPERVRTADAAGRGTVGAGNAPLANRAMAGRPARACAPTQHRSAVPSGGDRSRSMSGTSAATAIHNARINLLATLLNIRPGVHRGRVHRPDGCRPASRWPACAGNAGLGRTGRRATYRCAGCAWETAMTWDLALTWFIMPAVVALILGAGGLWLAKHTP